MNIVGAIRRGNWQKPVDTPSFFVYDVEVVHRTMSLKSLWRVWAKSLGEKAHKSDHVADRVAIVRTIIFLTYLITNCFIVAGVIRHWNKEETIEIIIENAVPEFQPYTTPSDLHSYSSISI